MTKKQDYCPPQITVLELGYAEPVCQPTSGGAPDYDRNTLDPEYLFS